MGDAIGYARVSSHDQDPALQLDALKSAGCKKVFTDRASGARTSRPQFDRMLEHLREGDTVVVWRLDRLGRSLPHLIRVIKELEERQIAFSSLTESIDTTTTGGKLIFHIFASLAEFERELIRERTKAGLAAAVARGRKGGRPSVMSKERVELARRLRSDGKSYRQIGEALDVGASTVRDHLQKVG